MRSFAFALLSLIACGKVTGGEPDAPPVDIDAPPSTGCDPACGANATCVVTTCTCDAGFTGDGFTCTAIQHWELVGTGGLTLDLGNNRGFMAVGLGRRIFTAPVWDSGQTSSFIAYDVDTHETGRQLPVPPGQNDFQASGYGAIFVANADEIFLIGDEAMRYSPDTNLWQSIPGYTTVTREFMRGESAGAWEGNTGSIYLIGGRDNSNTDQGTAVRFVPSSGTWSLEPGALPYTTSDGVAYALPGTSQVYLAGSYTSDSNRRHLAVHATSTSTWTALADAPADLTRSVGVGHYAVGGVTRLAVATEERIYLYNPNSALWDRSVALPANDDARIVMLDNELYAVLRVGTTSEIHKLISIEQ